MRVLEGHEELVRCIRFDNKRIVSGAYDGYVFEIFKRTAAAISRGKILSSSVCAGSCASIFCVMGVAGVIIAFGQVRTLRPRPRRMN